MVRLSPNLLNAYELTQFFDNVTFEIGISITQELGQCFKDQDISLPWKLSNSLGSLIGVA